MPRKWKQAYFQSFSYLYQLEKYYQLECSEKENPSNEIETVSLFQTINL